MGMKALGCRDVGNRMARGAEEEGLPLAGGSGSAGAAAACRVQPDVGLSDLSLLSLQLIVVKLSPLPTIKKKM